MIRDEADKLIAWWKTTDCTGMDFNKYVAVPLREILGDNPDEILEYLQSLPLDDLEVVSGCFEDIYRKFKTEKMWVELGKLEEKLDEKNCPWKVQAKNAYLRYEHEATYFNSYRKGNLYIVHGEIFIYCFDEKFEKLWDFSARDIWVRQDGLPALILHEDFLELHDWLGYTYKLTYEGKTVKNECAPERHFDGQIQRFKIVTGGICYGPCPRPEDEVEQHLTVTRDGRVWFAGYNFRTWEISKYVRGRTKQFKLSEETVKPIFEAFQACFSTGFMPYFATDIGSWNMTITTDKGDTEEFHSSNGSDLRYNGKLLTDIVSDILQIEDLWVFGGSDEYEEYTFCSVAFQPGGKTYYYIADDEDIDEGDYVVVPVGNDGKESIVRVMDIEAYCEDDAPFPIEDTRHVIRKCNEAELKAKLDELWRK